MAPYSISINDTYLCVIYCFYAIFVIRKEIAQLMPKLSKDEFIGKYKDIYKDDSDKQMEFLEDVADSFIVNSDDGLKEKAEEYKAAAEKAQTDLEMMKEKYINRFMSVDEKPAAQKAPMDKTDEDIYNEKDIIDIKEI